MNQVNLLGRIGATPELRFTANGMAVCKISLATSERRKGDVNGANIEKTSWHRCVLFGKQAETAAEHLSKGRQLLVTGKIDYRQYDDKDGNRRYSTAIIVDRFEFVGSNRGSDTVRGSDETFPPEGEDTDATGDANDDFPW